MDKNIKGTLSTPNGEKREITMTIRVQTEDEEQKEGVTKRKRKMRGPFRVRVCSSFVCERRSCVVQFCERIT